MADATLFEFICFLVSNSGVATSTLDIHYLLGVCVVDVSWSWLEAGFAVELICSDCVEIKVSRGIVPSPTETRTHVSHISGSNGPVYECLPLLLLGTIIIQTVHILQHDNADTGSLPVEYFVKHSPTYFQIIQPGSSTVTPPYQWRRIILKCAPSEESQEYTKIFSFKNIKFHLS